MTTAQDQQSRAAYEDGTWYWVEHEGWHDEPPTIAPACYKAECDAWYSYVFSGISTPYLKVLGPCELQAAAQERQPLTDREISAAYFEALGSQHLREQDRKMVSRFARAIEAAHGIKATP